MADRVILHCDINSFYASVELLDHPDLKEIPVAVSGSADDRHGIILAKNQPAKKFGIQTAETVWQARKKCPDLILLPPHFEKYRDFHERFNKIFLDYTDMVEPFSIDESWLDVTASRKLFGSGVQIADEIRRRVREELGITLSAGVSYNKIFAKMGSEYKKPDATTEITRENYKTLLWPLPVGEMFFVGKSTASKLRGIGIQTIGDLANAPQPLLKSLLGTSGPQLRSYARGEDRSPVRLYTDRDPAKSIGNGYTFRRDLVGEDDVLTALTGLCDTVAARLRKHHMKARGVKVDIKSPELITISRQKPLMTPTQTASDLKRGAMELIRASWDLRRPIRLITVTGINLEAEDTEEQLSLFSMLEPASPKTQKTENRQSEKNRDAEAAMDRIREKFGEDAIGFARTLKNDIGMKEK